jgi:Na+/H+ antiporter NhaB
VRRTGRAVVVAIVEATAVVDAIISISYTFYGLYY